MKNNRLLFKGMAMLLVLMLCMSVSTFIFAAEGNLGSVDESIRGNVDASIHQAQVASINITVPETATATDYFYLRFLDLEVNNTTSSSSTPYGYIYFQNGNVYTNEKASDWGGTWLCADGYKRNATYTNGETFNLTAKLNLVTGNINYYMDGIYFYTQRNTQNVAFGRWYGIVPIGETTAGFVPTIDVEYSIGLTDPDEIPVISAAVDETAQKISIEYTEALSSDTIDDTKLYKVNGKTPVDVIQTRVNGKTVEVYYDGTLDAGCEYMVELPKDIAGTAFTANGVNYQYKPASNLAYVTVESAEVLYKNYTFEESVDNTLTFSNGYDFSLGEGQGKDGTDGLVISLPASGVTYGTSEELTSSYNKWIGGHGLDATFRENDIQVLSMDIKKVNTDLVSMFRVATPDKNEDIFFGISDGNEIIGCYGYDQLNKIMTASPGSSWWTARTKIGTYTPGSWVNIKLVWDNVEKKGQFYVDDVAASASQSITYPGNNWIGTLDNAISDFTGFSGIELATYTSGYLVESDYTLPAGGLMVIDNFKTYGIKKPSTVASVSFTDAAGKTMGSYDTLDQKLNTIAVTFGQDMSLTAAASDSIKLYYGNMEISYTASYDSDTRVYTMTPALPTAYVEGASYRLAVNGLTTASGAEVPAYESELGVSIGAFYGVSLAALYEGAAAENMVPGEEYTIQTNLTTAIDGDQITVIVAEYAAENKLVKASLNTITADASELTYSIDPDAEEYPTSVSIYAWTDTMNMVPICNKLTLPVEGY